MRRGYDPQQVTEHLKRLDIEMSILAADRDAATQQAAVVEEQLVAARQESDRLRAQLRAAISSPGSVSSLNERLQLMLRLAQDEFAGLASEASVHVTEVIAAVAQEVRDAIPAHHHDDGDATIAQLEQTFGGFPSDPAAGEREFERMRRAAAIERAQLDEAAVAERAHAEEEFRIALALRCREALTQLTQLQADGLRTARQMVAEVDEQIRVRLAEASDAARRMITEAKREVDDLHGQHAQFREQLVSARGVIDHVLAVPIPDSVVVLPNPRDEFPALKPAPSK